MNNLKLCTRIGRIVYQYQIRACVIAHGDYCPSFNDNYVYMNKYYRNIKHYSIRDYNIFKNLQKYRLQCFCTTSDKKEVCLASHKDAVQKELQSYIEQKKEKLRVTEQRIKEKGNVILKDIEKTKNKVREKVEGIIEVFYYFFFYLYIIM